MSTSKKKKKSMNNIIRLIKWGWSETLPLSRSDDAWKSSEVDPCVYAHNTQNSLFYKQVTTVSSFITSAGHYPVNKADEDHAVDLNKALKGVIKLKNSKCILYFHTTSRYFPHPFIPLFIFLPFLFKFEIPLRQRQIDVCSAEFTVRSWCDALSPPKTVKADKQLIFSRWHQLRYHYACHCKWTTSSEHVCVCVHVW